MRMRRAVVAGAVLGLAAVTAGCSTHPGAAAVVDGHEISEAELEGAVADFTDIIEVTPVDLLNVLVVMEASDEVAEANGIAVSGSDALAALEAQGIDTSDFSAGGVEVARYIAMVTAAQELADSGQVSADMDAARLAADIQVNPRYGELDVTTGSIVEVVPAWIFTGDVVEVPVVE